MNLSQQQPQQPSPCKKVKKQTNKNPSKLGRKGDPRMHAAVKARLTDPKIELVQALEIGGFKFTKRPDGIVVDAENITLNQRKNQLSRRVRLFKQRVKEEEDLMNASDRLIVSRSEYLTDPSITRTNKKRPRPAMTVSNGKATLASGMPAAPLQTQESPALNLNPGTGVGAGAGADMKPIINTGASPNGRGIFPGNKDPVLDRALDEFKVGMASLVKKTMISAGYHTSQMDECDEAYLTFVETALQGELIRVQRIKKMLFSKPSASGQSNAPSVSVNGNTGASASASGILHANLHGAYDARSPSENHNQGLDHSSDHQSNCNHNHNNCNHPTVSFLPQQPQHQHHQNGQGHAPDGLHRRLPYGHHKAIVHKPINGKPHIDFLVNGKVECYDGYSLPEQCTVWPSQFKVDPVHRYAPLVGAGGQQGAHAGAVPGAGVPDQVLQNATAKSSRKNSCDGPDCKVQPYDPIVFDLKDVDFSGGEWENIFSGDNDLNSIGDDEVLGSLFSLRHTKKTGV